MTFRALVSDARPHVARLVSDPLALMAACAVWFVLGAVLELSRPLNHDVGWLLLASEQWLDGGRVYDEVVVEWNPPLVLYWFAPAVAWARALAVSEITALRGLVLGVAAAAIVLSDRVLVRSLGERRATLRWTLDCVLAFLFCIHVGADFGQREHLVAMLALPYAIALAVRARDVPLPAGLAIAVGVAAALGAFIKPQYAALLAAAELLLAARARSWRGLLRPELLAFVAVGALYAISVALFLPSYFEVVLPMALDGYWAYQRPVSELVAAPDLAVLVAAALCPWVFRRDVEVRPLGWAFVVATFACYAAMLVQGTGWRYSRIPFETSAGVLAVLALAVGLRGVLGKTAPARDSFPPLGRALGAGVVASLAAAAALALPSVASTLERGAIWRAGGTAGLPGVVATVIERAGGDRSVYFLSVGVAGAFPAVNYSRARWASRFSCLWPLAAVVRAREGDPRTPDHFTPERVDAMERYLRDAVASDLERDQPELLFVDERRRHAFFGDVEVDILAFFRTDPRFEAIWSGYERERTLGFYEVYRRRPPEPDRSSR